MMLFSCLIGKHCFHVIETAEGLKSQCCWCKKIKKAGLPLPALVYEDRQREPERKPPPG